MLYKVSPFGYFSRTTKVSRGPWFQEYQVEDDGLEYFYVFGNGSGVPVYLLTNNIQIEDREKLNNLYRAIQRNTNLAWFGGIWLGAETVLRVPCFKKMAVGWKLLSLAGTAFLYKNAFGMYNGLTYGPIISAFFRKYSDTTKADRFDITDRKREYYEIDTTQYMNYNFEDLTHDHHAHHGPQPVILFVIIIIGWRSKGQLMAIRARQVPQRRREQP